MKDILRWRTKGGAYVVWKKTGTSGGQINYPVGDFTCEGCGTSIEDIASSWAEGHAADCSNC